MELSCSAETRGKSIVRKNVDLCIALLSAFLCLTVTFAVNTTEAHAVGCTLAWDPNAESDLAGYKVYYGKSSGIYSNNFDVGEQTYCEIRNLVEGQTYYFSVTAYDIEGNESTFSEEISHTIPTSNTCKGDFDSDGDVDGSDLAVFSSEFGHINCDLDGESCQADFDNDGDVDGTDLAKFSENFGRTDCP
ncbi:MAG TPA: fibronectin type III domain-containing protein [Desulfobacterales bacterium]